MDIETHRHLGKFISYGKRLPSAIYLYRPSQHNLPPDLLECIRRAELAAQPLQSWNLLKFHTDQFAITFLAYPDFDTDPHPALAEATKINLNTGSVVRTDYRGRANPPILHRKETFLPPGDPRIPGFAALTKQEEKAGLYRDPSRTGQETDAHSRPFRDGFLTKANTFQKFYAPGELETLIEETLDAEATTLGLGTCVVFRSDDDAELFEANRNRRRIDWTDISAQLKFSAPICRERRSVDRYELHKELFDQFWHSLVELGRVPEPGEMDRLADVAKAAGGIKRAVALVVSRNGDEFWQNTRIARTEDVLVYLAMTKFRKRFLRREIPLRIMNDIRSFFGDLPTAQVRARDLLFAAGDPGEINLACEDVDGGWQDEDALLIHRSLLGELPPILRIYVHCAAYRYGDPSQADLIKIHKHSGKVTFQHYDDFDGKPLPELRTRIKVNLRNLFVEVFDHSKGPRLQLLYFKERFVGRTHPNRSAMEKFSAKLSKLGLNQATIGLGPDKECFGKLLLAAGLSEHLNPIKKRLRNPESA